MSQAIHIQHVRLFDGSNVIADSSVIMQNGVIIAVGNDSIVPTDVQIIDGMGHTLLPGFIDAHTHVFGSALKEALIFGVTTELDMFTDYHMVAGIKQQEATGQ